MKISTLLENTSCREDLIPEHGLSLYIETMGHKILFDSGQSDLFARNAEKMGIDLRLVDIFVLSHGHYDHGGGLAHFMKINSDAKIYVNENVFSPCYHGPEKYIGLNPELKHSSRLIFTGDDYRIAPGISLHTCNQLEKIYPVESYGLSIRQGDRLIPDSFLHEHYLLIEENGKQILFSGCSHKGILNISHWFHPDVLVGGFHFKTLDPHGAGASILRRSAELLKMTSTEYYTCHCTGTAQYEYIKPILGDRLSYLSTGSRLTL